jgi:hypothetical protein
MLNTMLSSKMNKVEECLISGSDGPMHPPNISARWGANDTRGGTNDDTMIHSVGRCDGNTPSSNSYLQMTRRRVVVVCLRGAMGVYRRGMGAFEITNIKIIDRIFLVCPRATLHVQELCCQLLGVVVNATKKRVVVDPTKTFLEVGEPFICAFYGFIEICNRANILEDMTMSVTIVEPLRQSTCRRENQLFDTHHLFLTPLFFRTNTN